MMNGTLKIVFALFLVNNTSCFDLNSFVQVDPDTFLNVTELIISKGYPVENYVVQTRDGYLLSMQRIPYSRKVSDTSKQRHVVLLIHGVASDSNTWVWNYPNQSLGFLLADNDYDVWMGNLRGNTYSRHNVRLSPDQNEFWDFSIDEKALIDIPSMIDFVLNKTGETSLSYVGYSEGTTFAFALFSQSPYYNKKINLLALYAPVAHIRHSRGIVGLLARLGIFLKPFYKQIGLVELFQHNIFIELFAVSVCSNPLRFICEEILFEVFGFDPIQLNQTRLTVYFNQLLAGQSTKELIHFSQIFYSNKFRMYDYGDRNQEYYNQPSPPVYDVSKITAPIALFRGTNDLIADPQDVNYLRNNLKSIILDYQVPFEFFTHADFILAKNAYSLIHKELLETLKTYACN